MKVQHIISVLLDVERPSFKITQKWVEDRYQRFHETTLKSILEQTFQDFRLWIVASSKNPDRTGRLSWDARCELLHDSGAKALEELDADFVAITRIDSDDLMHKNAMQEVHDKLVLDSGVLRRCLVFRKNIQWSPLNCCIGFHYRAGPPFHTHIFPRGLYKNFDMFSALHYVPHGNKAGSKSKDTIELSTHKICVVKHEGCVSSLVNPKERQEVISQEEKEQLCKEGKLLTYEPSEVLKILKDFGVEKL